MSAANATLLTLILLGTGRGVVDAQRSIPTTLPVVVTVDTQRVLNRFDPRLVWGAALDGHDYSETVTIYTAANIAAMLSAGWRPITYRLRTELGIETWHWNPHGRWSDAAHQQGYWTSDDSAVGPITISYGYRLPRRGRTIDDANNDGYSRIDDGDTTTFWKTNPYLDARYTHDPEADHAQWFTLDLDRAHPVQEIRLLWGAPFPRRYDVQYWSGDQRELIDDNPDGAWRTFARGRVDDAQGGSVDLVLAPRPVSTRFIRVVMYQSSHTAHGGNGDPRDSLGFALREVYAGTRDARGVFHDRVRHDTVAASQSTVLVSSTDPWHRAIDRDSNTAQPGFDLVYHSGLTNDLPMLVPTGLLFDTPENAANELRFLRRRGYPLAGLELGEEPDGQRVTPEDYAALYLQFATALRRVDSTVTLGGPSMQTLLDDVLVLWPDQAPPGPRDTWLGRFLADIKAHHRGGDYQFFSFEWYPFDDVCGDPAPHLAAEPGLLERSLDALHRAGVPDALPRIMTEYGYSAHLSPAEVEMPAALFDADVVGDFFAHGGARAFYFGYEPGYLDHQPDCPRWGNLVMFLADSTGTAQYRMPRYYAARLLTHGWADSLGGVHVMYPAHVVSRSKTDTLLSAYVLRRPDRRWSILLVNRDPHRARSAAIPLVTATASMPAHPIDVWQYSAAQYQFHEAKQDGRPVRDLPPEHRVIRNAGPLLLPPWSITVVVGP